MAKRLLFLKNMGQSGRDLATLEIMVNEQALFPKLPQLGTEQGEGKPTTIVNIQIITHMYYVFLCCYFLFLNSSRRAEM